MEFLANQAYCVPIVTSLPRSFPEASDAYEFVAALCELYGGEHWDIEFSFREGATIISILPPLLSVVQNPFLQSIPLLALDLAHVEALLLTRMGELDSVQLTGGQSMFRQLASAADTKPGFQLPTVPQSDTWQVLNSGGFLPAGVPTWDNDFINCWSTADSSFVVTASEAREGVRGGMRGGMVS